MSLANRNPNCRVQAAEDISISVAGTLPRLCGWQWDSPKEQVCLCLLFCLSLHQPLLICVNTLSAPHVFGSSDAMLCCGSVHLEVRCLCCGKDGDCANPGILPALSGPPTVGLGNAMVEQKESFSLALKKHPQASINLELGSRRQSCRPSRTHFPCTKVSCWSLSAHNCISLLQGEISDQIPMIKKLGSSHFSLYQADSA